MALAGNHCLLCALHICAGCCHQSLGCTLAKQGNQTEQLKEHQHQSRFGLLKHPFKIWMSACAKRLLKSIGSVLIKDCGLTHAAGSKY